MISQGESCVSYPILNPESSLLFALSTDLSIASLQAQSHSITTFPLHGTHSAHRNSTGTWCWSFSNGRSRYDQSSVSSLSENIGQSHLINFSRKQKQTNKMYFTRYGYFHVILFSEDDDVSTWFSHWKLERSNSCLCEVQKWIGKGLKFKEFFYIQAAGHYCT